MAAQALATRLQTDLDQALSENQLLGSSNARLNELESSQSNIISELKAQLEDQVRHLAGLPSPQQLITRP